MPENISLPRNPNANFEHTALRHADAIQVVPNAVAPQGPSGGSNSIQPMSNEQRLFELAFKRYEESLAKYDEALTKHNGAIEQNQQIETANGGKQKQADKLDKLKAAAQKVASHGIAGDNYISYREVQDLLHSSDPAQREAADILLAHWNELPATKHRDWGGGMNCGEMLIAATQLGNEATKLRDGLQKAVTVPPHPGAPPVPPNATGLVSTSQASTGTGSSSNSGASGGTSNTGGTSTSNGTGATGNNKPVDPSDFEKTAMATYLALPPFSSNATTGEGRMQDGMQHLQGGMEALEKDLAVAASKGDQAAITRINSQMQKLQAGVTALMTMLKQRQELESNMAKMFSEMAMSSIRNMR